MNYKVLSPTLHETADAAAKYFKDQYGLAAFKVEEPIRPDITYVTTLHAVSNDHHYFCIDVSESAYTNSLDQLVLECKNKILPVKLYVAIPKNINDGQFRANLLRAKQNGVGVIEVGVGQNDVIHDALSLSVSGVRQIDTAAFPAKYRQNLMQAQNTFLSGNPVKGCAELYDEIEDLTRRIALKASKKDLFRPSAVGKKINFRKDPWANVTQFLLKHFDAKKALCPKISDALLSGILAITPHRNESGHKPKSQTALIKRDRELRTRFEHAADLLLELVNASKKMRP